MSITWPGCSTNKAVDDPKEKAPAPRTQRVVFPKKEAKPVPKLDANCYCSITQEVMEDPVIAMDGFTYERVAIESWLKDHDTSPQTNLRLPSKALVPNNAIKSMITSFKDAKKGLIVPEAMKEPAAVEEEKAPDADEIDIDVNATVDRNGLVKISVLASEKDVKKCPAVDVVLIMDRSGSMSSSCVGVDEDSGVVQENGFCTLDLVKHAMKTCVEALRDCDRCALIIFDNQITRSFELTGMTSRGRTMAVNKIESVKERGSTNIYGAILEGIKLVEDRKDKSRNPSILFFTDGVPNVSPARGEIEAFKKVQRQKKLTYPVNTFGFGTWQNINSHLLYNTAIIFNGMYGYIQDASAIGTTFVNAISNVLTTAAVDVKFTLTGKEVKMVIPHVGDYEMEITGEGDETSLTVNLGSVRFGQTTDFVLEFPEKVSGKFPMYSLKYQAGGKQFQTGGVRTLTRFNGIGITAKDHVMRFKTIDVLKKAVEGYRYNMEKTRAQVAGHIKAFEKEALTDKVSKGILENLRGQNTKMLLKEKYMNKWGKHQCRQYIRSLNMQIKNNFKDAGVQNFGGELFLKLSDDVDDIFNNMPPPKPSLATKATKVISNPQSFAKAYNNVRNDYINGHGHTGGGCFSGNGQVKMADGTLKMVRDIRVGDVLETPEGPREVALVRKDELHHAGCFVNGLWITPMHPLRVYARWFNPSDLYDEIEEETCPNTTWYNFELRGGNSFFINGIELIALGHDNVIPSTDPAYSEEKDSKYGRGWMSSVERWKYVDLLHATEPKVMELVKAPLCRSPEHVFVSSPLKML